MSKTLDEGGLRFTFGDGWLVERYDGHPDYRNGIEKLKHPTHGGEKDTTAIDFIGIVEQSLFFIEVKDFREHRIETKSRVGEDLAREVAFKARDTIAGIVGASRMSATPGTWAVFVAPLPKQTASVYVVLWLEEDARFPSPTERRRHKHRQSVLAQELKRSCRWLTPYALVVNRDSNLCTIPDLQVSTLPAVGR